MKILVFCWIITCSTKTVLHVNKPTFSYVNSNKVWTSNFLTRWNTNKVQTSYFFQVDDVYKNESLMIRRLSFLCDVIVNKSSYQMYSLHSWLLWFLRCALLVINLYSFNLLIDDYELGHKVNA